MTAVMDDDNNTGDWAEDCNGEGQEKAVRDGRDSKVVMMAVAVENGSGGQQWQRQTTIAAEDNGMQDRVAGYEEEGQEWAAREGRDSRVAMMAVAAEHGSSGQQWRWWVTTVMADNDSGG
jgi:hypothetical protein